MPGTPHLMDSNAEPALQIAVPPEPTTLEKIRKLPWSIASDMGLAIFARFVFFGSVYILFLNQLGLTKTEIGFLQSLIPFWGLIALFISPAVARLGNKRTFLTFWGLRYLITGLLLLTPLIADQFGSRALLLFIGGITTVFAVSRAVGLTGLMPWQQEYIPNFIRGRYAAWNNVFTSLAGFAAVLVAGILLERSQGLHGFMILFGAGAIFGLLSIWMASRVPGGAPVPDGEEDGEARPKRLQPLQDRSFVLYLAGAALIVLATGPLTSFVPLFMEEQVGLSAGAIVFLQIGTLLGGLASSYLWGWAADRYGSKPVMLSGVLLLAALPVCWIFIPRGVSLSLPVAVAIAVLEGGANLGWGIGSARLLFVSIVPPQEKNKYLALYTAWLGIVGGVSQLMGGRLLDFTAGVSGQLGAIPLDPYTVLFSAGIVLPVLSLAVFRNVRADSTYSLGEFAGLFLHGNPILAVESLIRFQLARDERSAVSVTARLGRTQSPLTVDELMEALEDPRFFVRFEAIVSISRRSSDPRLLAALKKILQGDDPALSVIAAWALGRIGDSRASEALREALDAPYRSVQAHAARSLGTLADSQAVPELLERLGRTGDPGLQVAYAAALGNLGAVQAVPQILSLLGAHQEEAIRMELALALARLTGDENRFMHLLRSMRADQATASAMALDAAARSPEAKARKGVAFHSALSQAAQTLAQGDLTRGSAQLAGILPELAEADSSPRGLVLRACAAELSGGNQPSLEWMVLAVHLVTEA